MTNAVFRKLSGWLGAVACAGLLAACGGGGGSPGATPSNPTGGTSPAVASVVVTSSAGTIASSGADGTEVLLTALVKDANNNAVPGATVTFAASSGIVGAVSGVSDASGVVTATLSTKGDSTLRDIKISASVGSVKSTEITVKVVLQVPSLTLTTDSGTLASSGAAGSEVTVTASVRDSNGSAMANVPVTLSVDSGSLTSGTRITDAQGRVTEKLSTGGDATSRVIKITGSIAGIAPVTASVSVVGTKIKVSTSPTVNINNSIDATVKLVDSAGNALVNKPVTFSAASGTANTLGVKGGGVAVTDTAGQLILTYTANVVPTGGKDTISVSAMGETDSTSVTISSNNFTIVAWDNGDPAASPAIPPKPITTGNINTCITVKVHNFVNGSAVSGQVLASSSRGTMYSDSNCSTPHTTGIDLVNGDITLYVKATSPGVATLSASMVSGPNTGATTQGSLEFVAPYTSAAVVTVQSDPAVIGANIGTSTTQQSSIRAEVRDGTAANNLVKNAQVAFTIVSDASGGRLTEPSVVTTGSDGSATVSFVAGTSATALNGVTIRAQLQGASSNSATTSLTVSKKSLFISAGTGNAVGTPSVTSYSKDYAVLVTDASGNAVTGVNITASVLPRHYRKGTLTFPGTTGPWQLPTDPATGALPYACPNEDLNRNGTLDSGEDTNGNGRLDPGIPVSVTSSGTTDASGRATVTLTYPRDRALWLGVDLTIRGAVSGSEAVYVAYIPILPGASGDYGDIKVSPPGYFSPFGQANTYSAADCSNPN